MATDLDELYRTDFYSWTQRQAAALRRVATARLNTPEAIDWDHVAEEIGDLGKSQEQELWSRFRIIQIHLLQWEFQPEARSSSWIGSIDDNRAELGRLLKRNPGLKRLWEEELREAYPSARKKAALETGLPLTTFPATCPYTVEQALDDEFWPGPPGEPERG